MEAALANFPVPEFLPDDLPFWFDAVDRACASRGITSLHLKREVLLNKMPAKYLALAKDVIKEEHRGYRQFLKQAHQA